MTITKTEKKYIFYSLVFAIIWFIFVIPEFQNRIDGMNYILQFLIFNLGTLLFFQIFLKVVILKKKVAFKFALGMTLLFLSLDIWQPPFVLNTLGQFSTGMILATSSSDYTVALLGQAMGLNGMILYFFTYLLVPLILLITAGMLIKDFVKEI